MDTSSPLDNELGGNLEISGEIRSFLKETAKWAKFIAIFGFVMLGMLVLAGLFVGTLGSVFDSFVPPDDISNDFPIPIEGFTTILSFFYILIALFYYFPILYLYRFASKMQRALKHDDQSYLRESFANLKSHYKFIGIFLVIILGFYALIFVLSILAGLFGMLS